jgi:hypothetical protein
MGGDVGVTGGGLVGPGVLVEPGPPVPPPAVGSGVLPSQDGGPPPAHSAQQEW